MRVLVGSQGHVKFLAGTRRAQERARPVVEEQETCKVGPGPRADEPRTCAAGCLHSTAPGEGPIMLATVGQGLTFQGALALPP